MKLIITLSLIITVAIISFSFKSKLPQTKYHNFRAAGAAAVFGAGYTGASFDNNGTTCSNCHGGGSFGPTLAVTLLNSSNNAVTSYIPGDTYTLRLFISPTSGTPQYGFQTMSVKQADNSNLNSWGTPPANTRNILTGGGRNYVEQFNRLMSGTINIPWIAPPVSTGTVVFYSIGNAVNANGNSGGDNATTPNSIVITEAIVTPIRLNYFETKKINNSVKIEWKTAQETNTTYFNVQHSIDGVNFENITKINAKGSPTSGYTYYFSHQLAAVNPTNYYRLASVDLNGSVKYSAVSVVKNISNTVTIYPNPTTNFLTLKTNQSINALPYSIFSTTGVLVKIGSVINNKINIALLPKGIYYLTIVESKNTIVKERFVIE